MTRKHEYITPITAEVRYGRKTWQVIRPHLTRYALPGGGELYDEHEIWAFVRRWARVDRPNEHAA